MGPRNDVTCRRLTFLDMMKFNALTFCVPLLFTGTMYSQVLVDPDFENGTFNFAEGIVGPQFVENPIFTDWDQSGSTTYAVSGANTSGAVSLMLREGNQISQLFDFTADGGFEFAISSYVFEADVGGAGFSVDVENAATGQNVLSESFLSVLDDQAEFAVVAVTSQSFTVPTTGQYRITLTGDMGAVGLDSVSFAPAAVPEPSSAMILVLGAGLMIGKRRR